MKETEHTKRTVNALPLKGKLKTSLSPLDEMSEKKTDTVLTNELDDLLYRKDRRDCTVGVRITRDMKEILESLSAKSRVSESEIVYRILEKTLLKS